MGKYDRYKITLFIIIIFIILAQQIIYTATNSKLSKFNVKGNGVLLWKSWDLVVHEFPYNNAFSYGRIRFIYHFLPEFLINYEIYFQEQSYCRPYYNQNELFGYLQVRYENSIFSKSSLKAILGNLEQITIGQGLTYKEYRAKGYIIQFENDLFQFQNLVNGIGYIQRSDIILASFGFKKLINLNVIAIPTQYYNANELIISIDMQLSLYKMFNIYGEVGKEYILDSYNKDTKNYIMNSSITNNIFTLAGLSGIKWHFQKTYLKTTVNIEIRGYERDFNNLHSCYVNNDYTKLETRENSINNWRNYFVLPGKVYGIYFQTSNDIKLIKLKYDFFYNIDIEFLRLKYEKCIFNLNIYQTGIKSILGNYIEAFAGISNRNLQIPVIFTYELAAYPYIFAYLKFKF